MHKKIAIIIPVRDLLLMTMVAYASIATEHDYHIYIVDDRSDQRMVNWVRTRRKTTYIRDPQSSGLAYNWNTGISHAIQDNCTHFLVINNDVILAPETIDQLAARLDKEDVCMVTARNIRDDVSEPADIYTYGLINIPISSPREIEHPDFSCFMINHETIDTVGWFDEKYVGAYMEDCDYHARIALSGKKAVCLLDVPFYHYGSMTIQSDENIALEIHEKHTKNKQYFMEKFGHENVNDVEEMRKVYTYKGESI